ncbi:uncharacterized protein LOC142987868 [Anticarsia gemmatalis]|uniref:uncharacterized protein LOC142987868 n=1 Tax=Anticarsia gemmatalis TaxID=129554 RepID=UPI003F76D60F
MTESGWKRLGAERRSAWKCVSCKDISPTSLPPKEAVTLEGIMNEIREIKSQLVSIPKISEDIKHMREEILDLKSSCQFISDRMDDCNERILKAEKGIEDIEHKWALLEKEVQELKQYNCKEEQRSRLNNVEIKGIPQEKNENLFKIIANISTKIGYEVSKTQINYVSRVPSYNSKEKPIIISFINRYIKEEFIANARAKKSLKADDFGYHNSSEKIYVNDHLSADMKILLNKTREAAKKKNFNFVWVKYGTIHSVVTREAALARSHAARVLLQIFTHITMQTTAALNITLI